VNFYHRLIYTPADKRAAFRRALLEARLSGAALPDEGGAAADEEETPAAARLEEYFNPGLVPKSTMAYETRGARILDVQITTPEGRRVNMLVAGQRYAVRYTCVFSEAAWAVAAGTLVRTLSGVDLGGASTIDTPQMLEHVAAGTRLKVTHAFDCRVREGSYFLNVGVSALVEGERVWLSRIVDVAMFMVLPAKAGHSRGTVDFGFISRAEPEGGLAADPTDHGPA
jgi:lipopolysaccharide transport system ATP-binding protein